MGCACPCVFGKCLPEVIRWCISLVVNIVTHVMGVVMLIKKSFSRAGFVCVGLGLLKERGRGSLCLFILG